MNEVKDFKVTVIVITYGHENYIAQCLDGIVSQRVNFPVRVLIADDCSPDNTTSVVLPYLQKEYRNVDLEFVRHEVNKGMNENVRWCFEQINSPYTAFCEGDDYWIDEYKLQKQVDFMENNQNISMSFHAAKILRGDQYFSSYRNPSFLDRQIVNPKEFLSNGAGSFTTASVIFRSKIVQPIPEYFKISPVGDFPLALAAVANGDIGYMADVMCVYRSAHDSSWTSINNSFEKTNQRYLQLLDVISNFNRLTDNKFKHIVAKAADFMHYQNLIDHFIKTSSKTRRFNIYLQRFTELTWKNRLKGMVNLFRL